MKRALLNLFGATLMASPVATTGCATVRFGASYPVAGGTLSVFRTVGTKQQPPSWDVLYHGGKEFVPFK